MLTVNAESQGLLRVAEPAAKEAAAMSSVAISAWVAQNIEEVEAIWRDLAGGSIESPGQSYDFIRTWVGERHLGADEQHYVVGLVDGRPLALWPLHRKRLRGISVFTWFPGSHVGCNAPLVDHERLAALGSDGRARLWRTMAGQLHGADLLYFPFMPAVPDGRENPFAELGTILPVETLYRAEFGSWEECDKVQRSRSRRKHDRQQGDRLAALGAVRFEEVSDPVEAHKALDVMFRQRSARFREQGIRDVFVADCLTGFYHAALRAGSGIDVRLHVLRLDGEIVAVRYNIVHGARMFCLISSMSDDPHIQSGSPGKQCLLHVMQTIFDTGFTSFDMGAGFTDEKRHWCNVQVPLQHHYVGLNRRGLLLAAGHRSFQRFRRWAKANPGLKKGLRGFQNAVERLRGAAPASDQL